MIPLSYPVTPPVAVTAGATTAALADTGTSKAARATAAALHRLIIIHDGAGDGLRSNMLAVQRKAVEKSRHGGNHRFVGSKP